MRTSPLLIVLGFCLPAWTQRQVAFEESAGDRLRVFTDTYEVVLSKTNGAILGITDKTAKANLTAGSRNGCLWGSGYQGAPALYLGGCSFSAGRPDSFTYEWNGGESTLTFRYQSAPGAAQRIETSVSINFQPVWFDMQLDICGARSARLCGEVARNHANL